MQIIDPLYGEYVIEGVLEELISSSPVQRLKGVYQGGASYFVNEKWDVTRFDHSVGVMLLIRKLGGSIEEQITGLLHDVSHTAFSHVIDFVLENKDEDYHEHIYKQVIADSEIPSILKMYGYDYEDLLLDDSRWKILEMPAPDLCADRVDYTLRDMCRHGEISLAEVHYFIAHLRIVDGKMVLQNIAMAEWFAETYYKEVIDFFMNPLNIYAYDVLARTLTLALGRQRISLDTLLGTDEEVMSLLCSLEDHDIQCLVKQIHRHVKVIEASNDYDLHRTNKVRLIDPSVLYDNKLIRASALSEHVKRLGEEAKKKAERGMYVKVISI